MSPEWKRLGCLVLATLLAASVQPGTAQETQAPEEPQEAGASGEPQQAPAEEDGSSTQAPFGGPGSVQGQLADDAKDRTPFIEVGGLQRYLDWKDRLREEHGFSFSVDYTAGVLGATETLGDEDSGASGAVRFFGQWDLTGRDSGNTGTFVWKVENRHKYTAIPASGVAGEIGYVGLIMPVLSDIGWRLTNLFWKQNLNGGRVEIIAGMVDTTDWVDLYALAAPWNAFVNFALATGSASIPVPDDAAVGINVNAMITDNWYVLGGLADSNAVSTDPFKGFDTFFNDHEFFKTIELGWTTSQDRFYFDNRHVTYWHVDERKEAGVPKGWGVAGSFAHAFDLKWMPFLRAGYAKDGGSLLQKSVSAGVGYHLSDGKSLLGAGVNWGQPNETTFGPGLDDQYTVEAFARMQVLQNFQLTPDIQYIKNPARNPDADHSWVFGLRARVIF
jgi:porin